MRFTRYILAILFAILMTFCLFYLMQSLVMGTRSVNRSDVASVVVDFSRTVEESDTHTMDRRLPD